MRASGVGEDAAALTGAKAGGEGFLQDDGSIGSVEAPQTGTKSQKP
jgi:hypothetical protein